MAVGEIILSAFLEVLFEKLSSGELLKFARREGIGTQLKKWSNMLADIQTVLSDADDKQMTERSVKLWLEDLTDLAYDLDDVVDELATEVLRRNLMAEPQASTSKLWKFIPTCCTSYTPAAVMFDYKMSSKIEELTSRSEHIEARKKFLNLKKIVGVVVTPKFNREETSLQGEHPVYGRERDKEAILKLLRGPASHGKVSVIPILGMGGVGKTTFARLIYHAQELKDYCFNLKAWACVSDVFDIFTVTKTILQSVASETCDIIDLNKLQEELKEKLTGKKFVVVLDDIWNEDYGEWEKLCRPFLVGAPGSTIIITTRNKKVASVSSFTPPHVLEVLSDDDCLSLLAQHSRGTTNFDSHPNLKEIGEKIAKKCGGLPLAAKTLGGLLRTKQGQNEWEDILNSNIWDLQEPKSGIIPALHLSYLYLPSHLKQCFAFCSIFPKDYEFDKDELVLLWMAQGFLQQSGQKRMEDFGREYFEDLLSRSFFQQSSGDQSQLFVMHDLINDLAQYVAGAICFRLEDNLEGDEHYKISKRTRHASYIRQQHEAFGRFNALNKAQYLRTFMPFPIQKPDRWQSFYLRKKVLLDLWPKLQCLRVLSLSGYYMSELPDSISELKHLRYLNLSGTSITWLPEWVSTLYNLQTLLLHSCEALCKLPSSIGNLRNLRHLDITKTQKLQEMPPGIGKLTSLQTLSKVVLGKKGGLELIDLKDLPLLHGTLSIMELQNITNLQDAKEVSLTPSEHLDAISMEWSSVFDDSRNEELEMDVIHVLKPHTNLKKLQILFYGGMKFPSWIGDPSFSQIVNLRLSGCKKCKSLPPLGQLPMLKDLCVKGMHKIRSVGAEFYGDGCSFKSLEALMFEDMPEWEEWSCFTAVDESAVQFPCLRELTIKSCPKLIKFSLLRLPSLHKLDLQQCNEVVLKSVADLTSLTELEISEIQELTCLQEEFMQVMVSLKILHLSGCDKLVNLWVTQENVDRKECMPRNLEDLEIIGCVNLENLPIELSNLTALRRLSITECPRLKYFPTGGQSLEVLEISHCVNLENLPNELSNLTALRELRITECPGLKYFPTGGQLPTTLKYLEIGEVFTSELVSDTMIEEIGISLEDLEIFGFPNPRTLLGSVRNFENLVCLRVVGCDDLESFPERGLPAPNLKVLFIRHCRILKSLPHQIQSLTSLTLLSISDCPSLNVLPNAKGDLPPNLTLLGLARCRKLKPLSALALHTLTSLRQFKISDVHPDLVSFPDDCALPTTLTYLDIEWLENLKSLSSNGLRNLTSLKELRISNCRKLRFLPKDGLLATLSRLEIRDCPLLEQRCLKDKGEYWHKISDIPCLVISGS